MSDAANQRTHETKRFEVYRGAVLAVLLAGCLGWLTGCAYLHTSHVPSCEGGSRLVDKTCICALGTTWNGQLCQGTPQAGICSQGQMQFGNQCFCPDGTAQDGAGACVALDCAQQNAVVSVNQCVCAEGTRWDGSANRCIAFVCLGGGVVSGDGCVCPGGRIWQDNQCEVACIDGAVHTDADNCACPEGTVVSSDGCVAPAAHHHREAVAPAGCDAYGCWQPGGGCNAYGCWAAGGGCDAYGCWAAGGECNAYGCSDRGACNAYGCP